MSTVALERALPKMKRRRSVIPGFGLTMGFTLTYMSLMVLIPFVAMFAKALDLSWAELWALVAAVINPFFGVLTAWALVRYEFPGKRVMDALVDLPFALPTAVAGRRCCAGWVSRLPAR